VAPPPRPLPPPEDAPPPPPEEPLVQRTPEVPPPEDVVPAPTPAPALPAPAPAPGTARVEPALAIARAGKLSVQGRALASGETVPVDAVLQNGTTAAVVDLPGRAVVHVAPSARIAVKKGDGGEVVVLVERGQVFARTTEKGGYAIASADVKARPLGTAFLVAVDAKATRVATADGVVRLESDRGDATVRAGFESEVLKGRAPSLARPATGLAKALGWLPADARPRVTVPSIVRAFDFEAGADGFQMGRVASPGAHGSRGCLEGVTAKSVYARVVELEQLNASGVLALDPELVIEVTVRVDRRAKVCVQAWDPDRKENLAFITTVEAGKWTTVAAPLKDFTDASGRPRGPVASGRASCFDVFAGESGEALELRVDDVRFSK
jgi:hypothetical protein